MLNLANIRKLLGKPTADPMQAVQTDPRTEDALDKVAAKYRDESEKWKEAAMKADARRIRALVERDEARAELARFKATRERCNANLRRGSKPKAAAGEREAA